MALDQDLFHIERVVMLREDTLFEEFPGVVGGQVGTGSGPVKVVVVHFVTHQFGQGREALHLVDVLLENERLGVRICGS